MTGVVHGHYNQSKNAAFFNLYACVCVSRCARIPMQGLDIPGLQMCTVVSDFTCIRGFQTQVLKPVYQVCYTLNHLPSPIQGFLLVGWLF